MSIDAIRARWERFMCRLGLHDYEEIELGPVLAESWHSDRIYRCRTCGRETAV